MTPRVLYVEDDAEVRAFVKALLVSDGYEVTDVGDADAAVDALGRSDFDLVLTDYNLPGHDADWMLRMAREGGRLNGTPVIVLTGAEWPAGLEQYRVLRKPVDVAELLASIEGALPPRVRQVEAPCETPYEPEEHPAVDLTLYVTGTSRESQKAVRHLNKALRRFDLRRIRLTICDVAADENLQALEDDRIVVTPTLVRHAPLPKTWLFGDLSDTEALEEVIGAGLPRA